MQTKPFQGLGGSVGFAMHSLSRYSAGISVYRGIFRQAEKNHQDLDKHLKSTNSARTASRNVSNTLICYHPNKHLFSAQQSTLPFPGGQEPVPRRAPAAGSGCSAHPLAAAAGSGASGAGLAQRPAEGLMHICWAMCSSFHCLLLLQLMDRLILRDKWLGILLHKPRCLLIIWRYLFLPYSPCQGEQAVNCDIQNALKHLFKTCPRVYAYICVFHVFHILFLPGVNFRGSFCESLPLPFALKLIPNTAAGIRYGLKPN